MLETLSLKIYSEKIGFKKCEKSAIGFGKRMSLQLDFAEKILLGRGGLQFPAMTNFTIILADTCLYFL